MCLEGGFRNTELPWHCRRVSGGSQGPGLSEVMPGRWAERHGVSMRESDAACIRWLSSQRCSGAHRAFMGRKGRDAVHNLTEDEETLKGKVVLFCVV